MTAARVRSPARCSRRPRRSRTLCPPNAFAPTDVPSAELRDELYGIPNVANAAHVAGRVAPVRRRARAGGMVGQPDRMGPRVPAHGWSHMVRFAILMHESAHRLLFSNKTDQRLGRPLAVRLSRVRAHRRLPPWSHGPPQEEFGPNEPDIAYYRGYPIEPASWRRKLTRDAFGNSGWKNLKALLRRRTKRDRTTGRAADPVGAGIAVRAACGWSVVTGGSGRCSGCCHG